jgi:hypothetical protein
VAVFPLQKLFADSRETRVASASSIATNDNIETTTIKENVRIGFLPGSSSHAPDACNEQGWARAALTGVLAFVIWWGFLVGHITS